MSELFIKSLLHSSLPFNFHVPIYALFPRDTEGTSIVPEKEILSLQKERTFLRVSESLKYIFIS